MVTRRMFGLRAVGAVASIGVGQRVGADDARLAPTPAQSMGPFYPDYPLPDVDGNLRVVPGEAPARGTPMRIVGRVLDARGKPMRGVEVEIWQCDALGRYRHTRDLPNGAHDPGFQGYGRVRADASGGYRFETIRPVPYPGRTPHVHFGIRRGQQLLLVTQMYLPDEAGNARDVLFRRLGAREARERVQAALSEQDGQLLADFDLVVA